MLVKIYGWAAGLTGPKPPVPQVKASKAVIVPSFLPPTLILENAEGRFPAIICSVARSRNSFTGAPPALFERFAPMRAHASGVNLLPKPPPIYCISTLILVAGTLSGVERLLA